MRPSFRARPLACGAVLIMLGACDAASGVTVQPLPPADRPSPEARAGLPELEGTWRFAGWVLPDSAAMAAAGSSLIAPGELRLVHQRLDSISGSYVADGVAAPLVGEARRDKRFALVALAGGDQNRYVAGQVSRDTLWVELTSLPGAESWPVGTRAAWVRGTTAAAPFLRYAGQTLAPPPVDTLPPAPAESAAVPGMLSPVPGAPIENAPAPAPATPVAPAPTPVAPPVRTPIGRPVEQPAAPTPPVQRPAPQPTPESTRVSPPAQRPPRVLGVPVQPQPRPAEPSPAEPRPVTPRPVMPRPVIPDTIVAPPPPEPG